MATKKKNKPENPDMQAPKEAQEALWNALGHNSTTDGEMIECPAEAVVGFAKYYKEANMPETPGNAGTDFETEYGHLTTQVPQLLKAILRELYLIRRAK